MCTPRRKKFVEAMQSNHPAIAPSMLYAWASVTSGVPYGEWLAEPQRDIPAIQAARARSQCGHLRKGLQDRTKPFSKPFFAGRSKRACWGWTAGFPPTFSVTETAKFWKIRARSKPRKSPSSACWNTFSSRSYTRQLYGKMHHKVRINYYPPRGDNKEGWDNIDIFGWLGYPMQIKVDFLCRDSILAAPIVLDLVLFLDLRSAPECAAFRNGSASTSSRR